MLRNASLIEQYEIKNNDFCCFFCNYRWQQVCADESLHVYSSLFNISEIIKYNCQICLQVCSDENQRLLEWLHLKQQQHYHTTCNAKNN